MMAEAKITIGNVELNHAQSMALRVAVCSMLTELQDPKQRRELGNIAELYEARLGEVQALILANSPSSPSRGSGFTSPCFD